jgi:hypothetical protein
VIGLLRAAKGGLKLGAGPRIGERLCGASRGCSTPIAHFGKPSIVARVANYLAIGMPVIAANQQVCAARLVIRHCDTTSITH